MGDWSGVELDELELTGEQLVLRPWRESDAERVCEIVAAGGMREFLTLPDPYTLDDARRFIASMSAARRDGAALTCAAVEADGGRLVASVEVRRAGPDPDIGYWVAADARGHGYAAQAARLLAAFAFARGAPRVRLECAVTNVASIRTALAAGFPFEGVARRAVLSPARGPALPEVRGDMACFARLADDPDGPVAPAFARLPGDGHTHGGLTDGTVALRVLTPADAPGLVETEHDAESVRWNFAGQAHPAATIAGIAERAGLDWLVGAAAHIAIVDVGTGRYAGQLNLRRNGPPQVCGVGYSVHPAFRGRGYTARALRLMAAWAFGHAEVARLELGAKEGNVASQRAAARAGFQPDGVRTGRLRNGDGTFTDEVRYFLLNPALT